MKRILVIGPSWVGDMVMAQSLLRLLRAGQPGCHIAVLAPVWSQPLLERMPEVDEAIQSPFRHGEVNLIGRYELGRLLRDRFDQAIVLPNSFKSALIPWFARIPLRTGWRGEFRNLLLNDCRSLDPVALPRMVQRFAALASPAGPALPAVIPAPALRWDPAQARLSARAFGLDDSPRLLAICPGAEFGNAKQWPAAHYAELVRRLAADGWQVIIIGSPNDRRVGQEIVAAIPAALAERCHDLTGATSLAQAIDLIGLAAAVISNDSGLMHIAAAVNRPVVALYGSTSPDFTPPLADRVKLLSTDIECRPCFQRQCPLGHLRCLTEIHPHRVLSELHNLLMK